MFVLFDHTSRTSYTSIQPHEILEKIRESPSHDFSVDGRPIWNDLICKTGFICHRVNSLDGLRDVHPSLGVEIDLRDDPITGSIVLAHDPFAQPGAVSLGEFLDSYHHKFLILNIKSERIEPRCLEMLREHDIQDFFFLDSSVPMIFLMNKKFGISDFACRVSELEPIDAFLRCPDLFSHLWVDCFHGMILDQTLADHAVRLGKKTCLVSPELQGRADDLRVYKERLREMDLFPDWICCKKDKIMDWITST